MDSDQHYFEDPDFTSLVMMLIRILFHEKQGMDWQRNPLFSSLLLRESFFSWLPKLDLKTQFVLL